ncbi:MAG: DUF4178 domain-containing protein [Pseudomonadota bacterium]
MPDPLPRPEAPAAPAVRGLTCPACGGTVALRAAGYSVTVACEYCSSILDVADPAVKLVTEYHRAADTLEIPLGTRGTLRGVEWEAIGYLRRSENGAYPWEEYLLFNPYHGYRWLVTNGRGWSFGELQTVTPSWVAYDELAIGGDFYKRFFGDGRAQVDYVVGEFYWRVTKGEQVETADWVRPGWMLSREANAQEVSWTLSELLPNREMQAAFGVRPPVDSWPPLPHQPSPHAAWLKSAWPVGVIALALMLVVMIVFGGESRTVAGSFAIASDEREQSVTLGPLNFDRAWQRVEISAEVPRLENGWLDLDYALVNRANQQAYTAYGAAERYSGSDSDGPWTEGSRRKSVSVASVPAGSYDLVVEYKGNRWTTGPNYFGATEDKGWLDASNQPTVIVSVSRGALYFSNFLIMAILVAIPLLWGLGRHIHFEQARQAESDFAPTGAAAMLASSDDDE